MRTSVTPGSVSTGMIPPWPGVSPSMTSPAPRATPRAFGKRWRSAAAASASASAAAPRGTTFETAPDRQQAGDRDERQQPEEDVPPAEGLADDAGDRRADDAGQHPGGREVANIRGRSDSGRLRPIAT